MIRVLALVVIVAAVLVGAAAAGWVWTGRYDPAAAAPATGPIARLVQVATRRGLAARIVGLKAPPSQARSRVLGFREYDANCVSCHGAPGVAPAAWAARMTPAPTDFTVSGAPMDERRVFWITCHGVRLSGMPLFGARRSDDQIWSIAQFVRDLPSLTPQGYQNLRAAYGAAPPTSTLAADAACLRAK
jgi:mono/diheme cytochrome c family protein